MYAIDSTCKGTSVRVLLVSTSFLTLISNGDGLIWIKSCVGQEDSTYVYLFIEGPRNMSSTSL